MNVDELIQKLRAYPGETPVCSTISEGRGILINSIYGLMKDNRPVAVFLSHHTDPDSFYDKDTISLS